MTEHVLRFVVPAGYALLPSGMHSPEATAMLLSIGLQESRFFDRRQSDDGPARSFWQFERAGIRGVLKHRHTHVPLAAALRALRYAALIDNVSACQAAVEHNDTLAFVFARLLLWTVPDLLPTREMPDIAWSQYKEAWRPGAPHREMWNALFDEAWERTISEGSSS